MQKISAVPYIPASTTTVQMPLSHSAGTSDRKLWKFDSVIRSYQLAETSCYVLLALSVIGVILYSASVFLR